MFVFKDTYIIHKEGKGKDHRGGLARQSAQGRKPRGEPESLTGLRTKRGRFPGRKDNVYEDTGA